MPLTREELDPVIIALHGGWMGLVNFDVATVNGSNVVIGAAIAVALRSMGLAVSSPLSADDDDLAGIPDDRVPEFLDHRLPLAILKMVLGNFSVYRERENTTEQDYRSTFDALVAAIKAKETDVALFATPMTVSAPAAGIRCDVEPCPPVRYPRWTNRWV